MITSIFDLIENLPNPIPANSVPYFDWCNRTLIEMPASVSCPDLLACIDCDFVMSFFSSPNGTIDINAGGVCWAIDINIAQLQNLISSSWNSPMLTIGNTTHDLSTIFVNNVYWLLNDGITAPMTIDNQATLLVAGIDGMRYFIDTDVTSPTYLHLVVGLPTNSIVPDPNNQGAPIPGTRQHGQVLTWNNITGEAYRDNNQCCAQTLWLDESTETLHISGTNSVRLGVLNNQTLAINGNIICISQPGGSSQCIDVSETNNHTLEVYAGDPVLHYFVGLLNSNGILQNQVSLEHMNNQTLSLALNLLSISQPGGLFQTVDLSETNNHTLETYAGDPLLHYFVGILNSNNVLQNQVSLEHMNNQVLSYDAVLAPNALNISQPGGTVQTVNLSRVNNHTLGIVGAVLSIYNSIGEEINNVTLPTFDCTDVVNCAAIQTIISDIAVLAGRVTAAENQIALLRAQL